MQKFKELVNKMVLFCFVCKYEMFYLYRSIGSVSLCSHNTNCNRSVFHETLTDLEPTEYQQTPSVLELHHLLEENGQLSI